MTIKLELPNGHWAELKDSQDLTVDEARPLQEWYFTLAKAREKAAPVGAVAASGALHPIAGGAAAAPVYVEDSASSVAETLDQVAEIERGCMAFFIESWDFPFEPVPENLGKLPLSVYNALDTAIAPHLEEVFPHMKKGTPTTP